MNDSGGGPQKYTIKKDGAKAILQKNYQWIMRKLLGRCYVYICIRAPAMCIVSTKYFIICHLRLYHTSVKAWSFCSASPFPLLCEQCASNTCLNKVYCCWGGSNDCWDIILAQGKEFSSWMVPLHINAWPGLNISCVCIDVECCQVYLPELLICAYGFHTSVMTCWGCTVKVIALFGLSGQPHVYGSQLWCVFFFFFL